MRLEGLATEPQGEVLSAAADHTLSGGHMKAAGPMSSYSGSSLSSAVAIGAHRARPVRKSFLCIVTAVEQTWNEQANEKGVSCKIKGGDSEKGKGKSAWAEQRAFRPTYRQRPGYCQVAIITQPLSCSYVVPCATVSLPLPPLFSASPIELVTPTRQNRCAPLSQATRYRDPNTTDEPLRLVSWWQSLERALKSRMIPVSSA